MNVIERAAQLAVERASNNKYGYTNKYPDNQWWQDNNDVDCGSFTSWCYHDALLESGIDIGHVYYEPNGTVNPIDCGILKYFNRYTPSATSYKIGDLLISNGHTVMITNINPTYITHARDDDDGVTGDWTTGREIITEPIYANTWNWLYRLKDEYNKDVDSASIEGMDMSKIALVKKGDNNNIVLSYQYLMRYKLGYDKQKCNGVFDSQMDYNVKDFQKNHNLTVDGIIGENTGYSMIAETGYEEP